MTIRQSPGILEIIHGQHLSGLGVFQAKQPGSGKMEIIGLDELFHFGQVQGAVRLKIQWLGLDAAQNRTPAGFIFIGVGGLAHDVFLAALAVAKQGHQVGLGPRGAEQSICHTGQARCCLLQPVYAGIFPVHIIPHIGGDHGLQHLL